MTDYKATAQQWAEVEGWVEGSEGPGVGVSLYLDPSERQHGVTSGRLVARDTPAPATRLHSYKVGKAEPVEDWGKDHTLVNAELASSPTVDRLLDLQDRIQMGSLTLAEALKEITGATPAPAPASSLVDRVAGQIGTLAGFDDWRDEARAAIREVAIWLEENDSKCPMGGEALAVTAELLEQEAEK